MPRCRPLVLLVHGQEFPMEWWEVLNYRDIKIQHKIQDSKLNQL